MNAANTALLGAGGLGGCKPGEAKLTGDLAIYRELLS